MTVLISFVLIIFLFFLQNKRPMEVSCGTRRRMLFNLLRRKCHAFCEARPIVLYWLNYQVFLSSSQFNCVYFSPLFNWQPKRLHSFICHSLTSDLRVGKITVFFFSFVFILSSSSWFFFSFGFCLSLFVLRWILLRVL